LVTGTVAFDADSFDITYSAVDATARKGWWVAFGAAGGPTYTLTAAAGSFALTGTGAALKFNRVLGAGAGSFALTGTGAALKFNRSLSAGVGSFALTGTDASLKFNRVLSAASGGFVLTGTDATLTYTPASGATYTLTAASGAFALTGTDAALKFNRVLACNSGSIVLTGTDVSFTYPYTLPVGTYAPSVGNNNFWIKGKRKFRSTRYWWETDATRIPDDIPLVDGLEELKEEEEALAAYIEELEHDRVGDIAEGTLKVLQAYAEILREQAEMKIASLKMQEELHSKEVVRKAKRRKKIILLLS
jgi:hypothetical protein